jgi:hypothetical protein
MKAKIWTLLGLIAIGVLTVVSITIATVVHLIYSWIVSF